MADMEINGTILMTLKEYCIDNYVYGKIDNELSNSVELTKGLRLGCSLFPTLFNIYMERTLEEEMPRNGECKSKKTNAYFLLTMLMIKL